MSLLKYVERLRRMDELIRKKATGTPEEFAEKLGIGKTILMEDIGALRELGAEVSYCRIRQSYTYGNNFIMKIGVIKEESYAIRGGNSTLQNYLQFAITKLEKPFPEEDKDYLYNSSVRYYRTEELYLGDAGF